jgi:anaerobic selenocysteine-containing dehydrogenase
VYVEPKDHSWEGRLDVGNAQMMADLAGEAGASGEVRASWSVDDGYPFQLIGQRLMERYNTNGFGVPALMERRPYNPAYLCSADLEALGLQTGDLVDVSTPRSSIVAIVEADERLRPGLVSISHCYGDLPDRDEDVLAVGSPVARLIDVDDTYDPYSGQPLMANIPVSIRRHSEAFGIGISRQRIGRQGGMRASYSMSRNPG